MTILSETTEGMHNLFRLSSRSSIEGYYFKPRADRELLHQYSKGLIATTGCPSGEIHTRLRLGQYKEAREAAAEFQSIFGKENFFCEIMDHGLEIERRVQKELLEIAKDLGIPLLATNDLHYTHPVSYTHLDVYKRQLPYGAFSAEPAMPPTGSLRATQETSEWRQKKRKLRKPENAKYSWRARS